jgi:heterodisulfide reductase subunit B2
MKYLFFQGCTTPSKENAYELSMRKVASKLGIELVALKEENCCGFFVEPIDHMSAVVMAARDLALFDAAGLDAVTPCPACFGQLTRVRDELLADKKLAEEVNAILKTSNLKFTGAQKIKHFMNVLLDEVGTEKIKGSIVKPLDKLVVAPHWGCHILKPSYEVNTDNPEDPKLLEELITITGAKIAEYDEKKTCCGGSAMNVDEKLSLKITQAKLKSIKKTSAKALVTVCPACHMQFDLVAGAKLRADSLPALHYTQLLGLAQGFSVQDLGLNENRVDTSSIQELLGVQ